MLHGRVVTSDEAIVPAKHRNSPATARHPPSTAGPVRRERLRDILGEDVPRLDLNARPRGGASTSSGGEPGADLSYDAQLDVGTMLPGPGRETVPWGRKARGPPPPRAADEVTDPDDDPIFNFMKREHEVLGQQYKQVDKMDKRTDAAKKIQRAVRRHQAASGSPTRSPATSSVAGSSWSARDSSDSAYSGDDSDEASASNAESSFGSSGSASASGFASSSAASDSDDDASDDASEDESGDARGSDASSSFDLT